MKQFVYTTMYFTFYGVLPACLMCVLSRTTGLHINRLVALLCFYVGGVMGFHFDTPQRHTALLGFMMPKAIEVLGNMLEIHGLLRKRDWYFSFAYYLAMAVIGLKLYVEYRTRMK